MKGVRNILVWGISAAMMALGARAEVKPTRADTPYTTIGDRNIFDLRTPPVPVTTTQTNPPVNVKLIGVTTILGPNQAVFSTQEQGKPTPVTVVLGEGERQGGIEVSKIDMAERTASVTIDGRVMVLHLEEPKGFGGGGAPAGAAAAGAAASGAPATAPRGAGAAPNNFTYGARGSTAAANPVVPNPGATPPVQADPTQTGYGPGYGTSNPFNPQTQRPVRTGTDATMTPEQQIILIEAQRAQALKNGDSIATILPPTPLTSTVQSEHQQQQQQIPTMPAPPQPNYPPGMGPKYRGNMPLVPGAIGQ